jgi:hypothetical protein
MEFIPHIDRRANFSHRATPTILPQRGSPSPHLALHTYKWSFVSRPTASLESPHIESVLSTHMGLPSANREDRRGRYPWANWTRARRLFHPLSSVCPFGPARDLLRTRCSPQGVRAKNRPALAVASPHLSDMALSQCLSTVFDWDRRGTSSVRFSHHFLQVTPPSTRHVLHGYSSTPQRKVGDKDPPSALQTREDPGAHARPNRDAPRSLTTWPLRRRPLRDDPGRVPLPKESSSRDFCTRTNPHREDWVQKNRTV